MKIHEIREKLLELWAQGIDEPQHKLAKRIGVTQGEISRCCRYFGIEWKRYYRKQDGKLNHNFKDGLARSTVERLTRVVLLKDGRNLLVCDRCDLIGEQELPRHHKDRNRSNNTANNLEVLCWGCHTKEHMNERERDELGRFFR